MNKRLLLTLLVFALPALLAATACARAAEDAYEVVQPAQPTQSVGKIEVLEFFWYGCPHCHDLEPLLEKWRTSKPADVEFVRVPGVLNQAWIPHARAFYVAQKLGVLDKIHRPLFDALHKEKKTVFTEQQLQAFFESHGVAAEDFKRAYDSAETTTRIKQALLLAQSYRLTGVPTVIINGKYLTSAAIAGSYQGLIDTINALVAKEREAAQAKQ